MDSSHSVLLLFDDGGFFFKPHSSVLTSTWLPMGGAWCLCTRAFAALVAISNLTSSTVVRRPVWCLYVYA